MVRSCVNRFVVVCAASLFIVLGLTNAIAQKPLDFLNNRLSDPARRQLECAMSTYEDFHRTGNWSGVYKMLSTALIDGQSEDEFVTEMVGESKDQKYTRSFVEFEPSSYIVWRTNALHEKVTVLGCISVTEKGLVRKYAGTLLAERFGTEAWLFNSFFIINPDYHPC